MADKIMKQYFFWLAVILIVMVGCVVDDTTIVGIYSSHTVKITRKAEIPYNSDPNRNFQRVVECQEEGTPYSCKVAHSLSDDWWAGLVVGEMYKVTWEEKSGVYSGRYIWDYKKTSSIIGVE